MANGLYSEQKFVMPQINGNYLSEYPYNLEEYFDPGIKIALVFIFELDLKI